MNIREFFAGIFGESEKRESSETETMQSSETMITAAFLEGLLRERLSGRDALKIPAFAAAVELISTIIAGINFKLYRYEDNKIKECEDRRERLFNAETGDLLNGFEMKKAMVRDYMISGNAYIYINMGIDGVESLHYVDEKDVSVIKNSDPIFKRAALLVGGGRYFTHEFIIVTRNSVDGVEGVGVLEESDLPFGLAMNILKLLNKDSTNGGLKKGYLTSDVYLDDDNLANLKEGYAKFQKNPDGILVLNEGIKFQDASSTVVELEIKDIYKKIGDEVGELAGVPAMIRNGTAGNDQYRNWFRSCVIPKLNEICAALNDTFLKEDEKGIYFWRADTTDIENGDLKSMFEAYDLAYRDNFLQIDEIREKIGYPALGFNYIKLGLDTVLYDPESGVVYTPNTNETKLMKGGIETSENK